MEADNSLLVNLTPLGLARLVGQMKTLLSGIL